MNAGEVANVITAIATTIGALVATLGVWISYRSMRAVEEDSLPDIGFGKMEWWTVFDRTLLEVEIVFRNQSHRDLHIHESHFITPKKAVVGHSREYGHGGYYPTNFRIGPISESRVIGSAGEMYEGFRGPLKADRDDPEYYLELHPDDGLIECKIVYSFGAGHGKRRKLTFSSNVPPRPDTIVPLRTTVDYNGKIITVKPS